MANKIRPPAVSSEVVDVVNGDAPGDTEVITADDIATVTEGRILGPNALDGLPTVDPVAAASRAAGHIAQRGLGANAQAVVAYIAERAVDTAELNVVILEQLAERLLNAEEPADILTPFDPEHGKDYFGQPIEISSCNFLESDFSEGFPWYCSLSIRVVASGEQTVITVGGEKLMYQVAAFDMHGAWPQTVVIHQRAKPTKAGFYPLELRPAK